MSKNEKLINLNSRCFIKFGNNIFKCQIGAGGLKRTNKKVEGDKATPIGNLYLESIYFRSDKVLRLKLEKRNIRYDSKFVTSWQDCGRIVKTDRTNEENKAIFGNCCENQGLTILHGKLYLCPFSAHATNLKAIPLSPTDIVDLEAQDELQLKDQIKRLYFNTEFLEACRACNGRHPNVSQVEAAVQVKKPLEYERVTETNNVYF